MQPKFSVVIIICDLERLTHQNTLEHLRHITQVERVVELCRNGQHSPLHLEVHIDRGLDSNASLQLLTGLLHLEVAIKDLLKDQSEGLLSSLRHIHNLEVTHEARCQGLTAAARRSCCADDCVALDFAPAEVCTIVEAIHVNELSEQLNRRLRTVELLLRHVDIIDEDEELGVALYAPHLLSFAHELAFDVGLRALALGLGGEV